MGRVDTARVHYLFGMALLNTGALTDGIDHMISARELDPRNIQYKIGGIYALAKGNRWEAVIDGVNDIMKDETLDSSVIVNDLNDLGMFLLKLCQHFLEGRRFEAAAVIRKIVEEMVTNRMLNMPETDVART